MQALAVIETFGSDIELWVGMRETRMEFIEGWGLCVPKPVLPDAATSLCPTEKNCLVLFPYQITITAITDLHAILRSKTCWNRSEYDSGYRVYDYSFACISTTYI